MRLIHDAQVIVGDEIVDHVDNAGDKNWLPKDFPSIAPPFNNFFFEGYSKQTKLIMGAWVLSEDFKPKPYVQIVDGIANTYELPANTRWVMTAAGYFLQDREIFQLPVTAICHVSPEGLWLDKNLNFVKDDANFPYASQSLIQQSGAILPNIMAPMFLALSIFHCKNVELVEVPPVEKLSKSHKKKYGNELVTYKTLRVKKNIKKSKAEAQELAAEKKKYRGHLVHGHFKTFTEDAPLLGRAVGTYWWGEQLRGDFSEGAIVKEYKVSDE